MELNFRVPGTSPEKRGFRTSPSRPDYRLPAVIAFFGANGSGKTTLLRALINTINFAADSFGHSASTKHIEGFFPFSSETQVSSPTIVVVEFDAQFPFEADLYQKPQLCRYSLVIERGGSNGKFASVAYESLHIFPKGRQNRIMVRRPNERVILSKEFKVGPKDSRLSAIPKNASAISTLAAMQVSCFPDLVDSLQTIIFNVAGPEPLVIPDNPLIQYYRHNPEVIQEVRDNLRRFDLGIENFRLENIEQTGEWIMLFTHQGLDYPVPFVAESSGTRQIVRLFPQLHLALDGFGLAVIDALDNELHTELTLEILNWFRRCDTNPNNAQLICSLHDTATLDELEKDEVFFVEKNQQGATTCYGAKDISGLRRDGNLQKHYRSGALGAVPTFG